MFAYTVDMKRYFLPLVIIAAFGITVFAYMSRAPEVEEEVQPSQVQQASTTPAAPVSATEVEAYVRENISELSPVKEQFGGTYYVTQIRADSGRGIVSYEDGHFAYTADFTYDTTNTMVRITSFTVRDDTN